MSTYEALRQARLKLAEARRKQWIRANRKLQADLGDRGRLGGLIHFVRYFWPLLEPNTTLVEGEPLYAMIMHLEAVTRGEIKRLLINVSPGSMKSLLVMVFWPAWEWGACEMPWLRYVTFAYAAYLTERDNQRFRDIVCSPDYQEMWGYVFKMTSEGQIKPANDAKGWKFSSSMRGVGTGERGHRILADDLHNIKEGESEAVRTETVRWAREGMSNRLNDMEMGVIIYIGQRVHDDDVSNALLKLGTYIHLSIANEYHPKYHCSTDWWEDTRTEVGQLAWKERFPAHIVAEIKRTLGPVAYSAQYQQSPEPRGGGIIKREYWREYELPIGGTPAHQFEIIIASLDPAFTAKQENDPSGFVIAGIYRDKNDDPHVLLLHAWNKWLELHGKTVEKNQGEKVIDYLRRAQPEWGLVEQVAYDCTRMNVSVLLIENKASGHDVANEIQRLYAAKSWQSLLIDPGSQEKRARAYSVQHLFAAGMFEVPVWWECSKCKAPMKQLPGKDNYICPKCLDGDGKPWTERFLLPRAWADEVMTEAAKFRGLAGEEDNLVDALTQMARWMRDQQFLIRPAERIFMEHMAAIYKPPSRPLYDA